MPWSSTVGRSGIYTWKRRWGPGLGRSEGNGLGRGAREEGGREAVFTSVRSEWLVPRSRPPRPRVFTRREQHGLRARGRGRATLGQQRGLEGAVASAVAGRQHLAGEVVQGVVGF